jgi:zinc protease
MNALKVGLKANNDEELGKVALEARMYAGPLATPILGTESGLQAITLEDVQAFARTYYTRKRLTLGLGGGFSPEQKAALLRGMGSLPETDAPKVMVSEAEHLDRSHLQIITKDSRATAISFGIPLREWNEAGAGAKGHRRAKGDDPKGEAQDGPSDKGELLDARVNRAHPDFPALWIATSHLGQHRDSTGVLYQRLREIRGLNYGDYAYLEAFPNASAQFQPSPGVARTFNHWQVWLRPVPPASAAFAIKGALFEMDKLIKQGLSEQEFKAAQTFLVKFMDHLTDTGAKRLGHDMDNAEFGLGSYADTMKARLGKVTREDVNRVIRKYLRTTALDMVVIAKDAEAFKQDLLAEASTVPVYTAPKPELKAEDEAIRRFKLDLDPKDITITPVEELFK